MLTKEQRENIVEFLNERQDIYDNVGQRNEDLLYLHGAIRALEIAGYDISYNEDKQTFEVF